MFVILTEKPKVVRKIANFLGDSFSILNNNPLTIKIKWKGKEGVVIPAAGHLLTLNTKEKGYPVFNVRWEPINGFQLDYLKNCEYWLKKANEIYIATDYDIEGELIAYNILKYANCLNKKIYRVKFSSLTKEEIINSFENPIKLSPFLIKAGNTRHHLDWFYGINLSRALMSALKYYKKGILSIGRVQGAILKLVYDREKEIENFKSKYYYTIDVLDLKNNIVFQNNKKIEDEKKAKEQYEKLKNEKIAIIDKILLKEVKQKPFPNFNLPDIQEEVYKIFKISPSKTLKILQTLYEEGFISYPRTSSQKLPENSYYLNNILKKLSSKYKIALSLIGRKPIQGKKEDPAHPAIHPTGVIPKDLGKEEQLIYDLIVKRFLSSFMDEVIFLVEVVYLGGVFEGYYYKGQKVLKKGFLEVYNYYEIKDTFVGYKEKQKIDIKINLKKTKTKPPNRYNQGELIKILENKKIGTKATRAQILEILYKRNYLKGDRTIYLTPLGKKVIEIMLKHMPKIVDLKLTKEMEEDLEKIIENKKDPKEILDRAISLIKESSEKFKEKEKEIGEELIKSEQESNLENSLKKCECGGFLIEKKTKKGEKFIGCINYPKCKITFSLPKDFQRILKTKCKKCGGRLIKLKTKKYCIFCKIYY